MATRSNQSGLAMQNTDAVKLNLARKWRSKTFDHIIGQPLAIRILKNSLYLGHYFPVYLFSGQRGCGKTTTARVFAAALNCSQLETFQKNPKGIVLPCLTCESCVAMQELRHPDFIEMDAASHTGVDSIRQLIESSSFLPVLGRKKVYLIDEAHMLSRSSFNALLKLLEEPPASVLFILATTEVQKIIDTVRSRCFRLIFKPLAETPLFDHLKAVCSAESIRYDDEGLSLIVRESEGSARDALTILEQVRFATSMVTKEAVLKVLGHVDTGTMIEVCEKIFCKSPAELLLFMQQHNLSDFSADFIWHKLLGLIRAVLWHKYGVRSQDNKVYRQQIARLAGQCSIKQLNEALEMLYQHESLFNRTADQSEFLEILLARMCTAFSNSSDDSSGQNGGVPSAAPISSIELDVSAVSDEEEMEDDDEQEEDDQEDDDQADTQRWSAFITSVSSLEDPLLHSIFTQSNFESFDVKTKNLCVSFSRDFVFFQEWLEQTSKLWVPLLHRAFGPSVVFQPLFTRESAPPLISVREPMLKNLEKGSPASGSETQAKKSTESFQSQRKPIQSPAGFKRRAPVQPAPRLIGPRVNVSDTLVWKKSNLILSYFPGTVTLVTEKQL